AEDVHAIACIKESRGRIGTYTDGSSAQALLWKVRLGAYPSGKPAGGFSFSGLPPYTKRGSQSGGGGPPGAARTHGLTSLYAAKGFCALPNIRALSLSPDGATVLVTSDLGRPWSGPLSAFAVTTGQALFTLPHYAASAAFSPDGKRIASGGQDAVVK